MLKNVVLRSLKLDRDHRDMTPRSVLMLYGQMMMIHSQKLWVITHIWPQEPPTAPKAVSADHRAACMPSRSCRYTQRSL